MCQVFHLKIAMYNLYFQNFIMFLNVWDVQKEISVVSAHVNLNGLMYGAREKQENGKSVSTLV